MSKKRYVDTKFWDDAYITSLEPMERYLFLYLITNPLTKLSGIYELQLRRIVFDTGLDMAVVKAGVEKFQVDAKLAYIDGWMVLRNFTKHQNLNQNMKKGIVAEVAKIPKKIAEKLKGLEWFGSLSHLDLDSILFNSDSNLDLDSTSPAQKALLQSKTQEPTPSEIMEKFLKDLHMQDQIEVYRDWETDRKSTRLNSSHSAKSRMPSSA